MNFILKNNQMIYESLIMGIITYILGIIIFNITFKNKNDDSKPYGIEIVFFITGVVLHIFIEMISLNRC